MYIVRTAEYDYVGDNIYDLDCDSVCNPRTLVMDRKKVEKSPKMRWRKWRKVPRAHLSIQRMEKSQWRKVEKSGEKWRNAKLGLKSSVEIE